MTTYMSDKSRKIMIVMIISFNMFSPPLHTKVRDNWSTSRSI